MFEYKNNFNLPIYFCVSVSSADGNFDVQYITNAIVNYAGKVTWFPPAIYKSACKINIEHFPFDEQNCKMKFGPWSHDSSKVRFWRVD